MSSANEYHCSVTPEQYEPAPSPPELTFEEYEVFISERASMEERYLEAVGAHEEWKKKKEEWKAVEEKKKEEERQGVILREKQEAEEKQRKLDELKKAEKEAADGAAEKKRKNDLKEQKRLQKEQTKAEKVAKAAETMGSEKGKAAATAAEATLVEEERGMDVDTEGEKSEASKEKALKKLKEIRDGKWKATVPTGPKRKWATKSTSVVEESDGENRPDPSKRVKVEISGPAEGEDEFTGNIETLANKVDILTGQVIDLRSQVDDLVDDFQLEKINSLEELILDMEEWQASCTELKNLEGINSEALWRVMGWWLEEDMAQLRAKGLVEPEKMNVDDLYEKHNCDDFMVEDLDLGEKVLNSKVWKSWKPYGEDLDIPALDDLFVMAPVPREDNSKEDEDEDSSAVEDEENALAGGTKDMEMEEAADVVGASDA
ncbi:hypothetical protein EV421DRAFT_1912170 [Armillaria borealis]|uniref:Uncharacterized protein n=1 Tax=Armillaria borealis TaxID=47425 RepID=A0AA39IVC2_9AGAR|nr:hypothetical protein EV421DRAFT_1912170 [Armillaria borealis]